jgi:putative transposase
MAKLMTTPPFTTLNAAYQLHFYFCFKTRYLKPLFSTEAEHALLRNVIDDVCVREQYHLLKARISPEHLRFLLSMKPEQTISHAVKMLKGNLSREFGAAFPQQLMKQKTSTTWARGYFARSSGKVNVEAARAYVDSQVDHHGYKGDWAKALKYRNPEFKSPAFDLAHCVCMLDYHLVLVTKYRTPLFDEAITPRLIQYVMAVGRKHGFVVDRMTVLPDHVHLIVEARPSVSARTCVQALMNNAHHWMEKHYYGALKQTGCWDVWQPSFYAGTVGVYSTAQVERFLG